MLHLETDTGVTTEGKTHTKACVLVLSSAKNAASQCVSIRLRIRIVTR